MLAPLAKEEGVFGLDEALAGIGDGRSAALVLAVALLLGVRHAADPDHLVAVSTLVASERERPVRRAGALGLAWGTGHGAMLVVVGVPVVVLGAVVPGPVQRGAEVLIGIVLAALALRLLVRWRRGHFHAHPHAHGGVVHRHLHRHDTRRGHAHEHVFVRSPLQAFGIGLLHGLAGSAAVALLLVASVDSRRVALAALLVFAGATAASMAALSSGLGYALGRGAVRRRLDRLAPVVGAFALLFGVWYAAVAVGA